MHFLAGLATAILALVQATFGLAPTQARAAVLFGGDMMFDRTIRTTIAEKGGDFIFSCIDDTLQSTDLVVANLEGPITAASSLSEGTPIGSSGNYVFTFPPSTAELLAAHRIAIVNLGNNHILNFGASGVRSTESALARAGVGYFGDIGGERVVYRTVRSGVRLAFINYNEFGGNASTALAQIKATRAAGELPIVYAHWGVEYASASSANSRELAHRFVDAGAVLVVGSHPHVVQEHETYRGVPIYYSLGNFIFDQYWNDAVRRGLLLKVVFTAQGAASIREIPIELEHDRRTCPVQ